MLTHANLTAACSLYMEIMTRSGPNSLRVGEERFLCILPLFHIYSLTVVMLLGFRLGAELVLHPRFDPAAAAKDIVDKKITVYMGVPTMHVALLSVPGVESMDWSSLRLCASGGAPLPVAVQERFEKVIGCRLTEGWGMTETSPIGTFTPRAGPVKRGSCGIPYPGTEMKFIDVAEPGPRGRARRARRDLRQGPKCDEGLLEAAESDRQLDDQGRILPHRRRRLYGRGRLRLYRRPHQGHAAMRRIQRLSAQHRGGDLPAPVGRGSERDRRAGRLSRRDPEGVRQVEGRRAATHASRT